MKRYAVTGVVYVDAISGENAEHRVGDLIHYGAEPIGDLTYEFQVVEVEEINEQK